MKKNLKKPTTRKRFIALARVSSREQEKEGYSLDVQEDALRAFAEKDDGSITKLWRLAETATKTEQRTSFRELLVYAKKNAEQIDGLLVYKVDRAARNMSDYGKLEELESVYGVPLIAISQHTQDNPAGRMARRMLASMASFFTEQLAVDVKEGLARRVRDGWFPTVPPYGYSTERVNSRSVVRVEPGEAENVKRIFHLYAHDNKTLDGVIKQLDAEARAYTVKQPHWVRSKIHRILRDRSYIGDVRYHDGWVPGRQEAIIDGPTFARVQELLGDKTYKAHELTYAGELIVCGHCGRPVTGEIVKKKSGKEYVYYRCSRYTAPGHPRIRLREGEIEKQMLDVLVKLEQPEPIRNWFRSALIARATHDQEQGRARARDVQRQLDEVRRQQERLLNLHLAATIDESAFSTKNAELRDRIAALTLELQATDRQRDERAELGLKVFELSQGLHRKWLTADYPEKKKIIEMVCLNLTLTDGIVCISTRKPFNCLVEGLSVSDSGEGEIRTPATLAGRPVFETGAFNHSATSPGWRRNNSRTGYGGQKARQLSGVWLVSCRRYMVDARGNPISLPRRSAGFDQVLGEARWHWRFLFRRAGCD
jgi:site-specific DNA recombinase